MAPCLAPWPGCEVLWYNTWVEVRPSALLHGLSEEAISDAVANAIVMREVDDGLLFIGGDQTGQFLEVIGRDTGAGLVVFHAMPLRASYRERYLP
jgi:hypothetical protein